MFVKQFATAAAHQSHNTTTKVTPLTRRCCISTRTNNRSAPAAIIQATNIPLTIVAEPLPPNMTTTSSSSYQTMNSHATTLTTTIRRGDIETSPTASTNNFTNINTRNNSLQQFSSVSTSVLGGAEESSYFDGATNKDSTTTTESNNNNSTSSEEAVIDFATLQELSNQPPTPVRLADMYKYATMPKQRLWNARFLKKEFKIRLAHRAMDLLTLPHGLNLATPIQKVAHTYMVYLRRFVESPEPMTPADDDAFTELLRSMLLDRSSIPMEIARGISTWRDHRREDLGPKESLELEDALIRFFTARVGLRLLTEHHILSNPKHTSTSNAELLLRNCKINESYKNDINESNSSSNPELGCIRTNYDPVLEVRKVAAEVKRQTMDAFGVCPEIDIRDCSSSESNFTYVPHHLQYMLVELLKNSCKATVMKHRRHRPDSDSSNNNISEDDIIEEAISKREKLPPIRIVIAKGAEDVSIQISDRGGGVPRSVMRQIFQFGYIGKSYNTFSNDIIPNSLLEESDFGKDIITGECMRGFGLPLARIYARYFGGELTLKSMEGYGLDAYLYLPQLGDACENLPLSVRASPGEQTSLPTVKSRSSRTVPPSSLRSRYKNHLERESRRRHMLEILSQRAL